MKNKIDTIIIARDGWPLEQIIGAPIRNFFRRLFLGHHTECRFCYERRMQISHFTPSDAVNTRVQGGVNCS